MQRETFLLLHVKVNNKQEPNRKASMQKFQSFFFRCSYNLSGRLHAVNIRYKNTAIKSKHGRVVEDKIASSEAV